MDKKLKPRVSRCEAFLIFAVSKLSGYAEIQMPIVGGY